MQKINSAYIYVHIKIRKEVVNRKDGVVYGDKRKQRNFRRIKKERV